ncbi:MAG: NAD(P)/FAD-dependent oxidoreductase [Candidatus Paceibacterota bacterium]|jgi:NADH dehydrogenase
MEKPVRVVIVGNGFGGIYALKYLHKFAHNTKNIELSLISEKNYFLFTPLLHEVATGGLNRSNIVEPIRKVLGCCLNKFYLGKAQFIDTVNQTVTTKDGAVLYDYLVLATGATTNFYGIPGAEQYSYTLKSIEDAINIKNRVISQIEHASQVADEDKKHKMLRFVVVGGGPTGVELVAELAELIQDTFSRYYRYGVLKYVSLVLIHRDKELLAQFGEKIRQKSLQVLRKKGVNVMLESSVTEVGVDFIGLADGQKLESETVIWVGGVRGNAPEFDQKTEATADGRLIVDKFFALTNHKNIFAIGDLAAFKDNNGYLPALAQVAEQEARTLAQNISLILSELPPKEFRYKHLGSMLSLGQWMAAGEVKGFTFYGKLAWWIWRTVYLFKFISLRKKLRVAIEWTINLLSARDISEL